MRATRTLNIRGLGGSGYAPAALALFAAAVGIGLGCRKEIIPSEPRTPREIEVPEYLKDTVGELARFSGREAVSVQGYGFVTGLDGTGTKVVPPGIRQQILEMMHLHKVEHAEQILSSPDNAVVIVLGMLEPGIGKGELFDLEVRALPTTETTSLEGGFLLECDLARVMATRSVDARSEVLAAGRGGVFVSPFAADEKGKAGGDPRIGRVLAGGKAVKTRHFRLVLLTPSVRTADQIVRLINARFPACAKGNEDPGRVDLEVPREYLGAKDRFLDLVGAIYLRETPDARDQRVSLLLATLESGKDMDRVSICLEAFGPSVVPRLRPMASSPSASVRFYVGRTLAGLQDATAVSILEPIALDDGSEFQESAVEALGRLQSGIGLGVLGRVLNARSARVRVAAWQAMARLASRTFVARTFADRFTLSVVPTQAEPFVYVSRTLRPQIAVFGDVAIRPPVLAETRRVSASAIEDARQVVVIMQWRGKDYRIEAPLDVRGFVEKLAAPMGTEEKPGEGLDLGYSDVVGILNEMSRKRGLSAPVVLQPLGYHVMGDRPVARPIGENEP